MTPINSGDMARQALLGRQSSLLKTTLTRLTQEMTTGEKSDLAQATAGDFRALSAIDHSLSALGAYKTANAEATLFAETVQRALETTQTLATDAAPTLLQAGTNANPTQIQAGAQDARQRLFSAVAALNVRAGDRYALSGAATDQKPLAGGQDLLNGLTAAIAGQVTAAGVISAVDAWFAAPAGGNGFTDQIYGGSATPSAPFRLGDGDGVSLTTTATDPAIRATLKGLALAALVAEGALPGDRTGQSLMMKTAGEQLMTAGSQMSDLRGAVGSVEAHIGLAGTRASAEETALQIARTKIASADPYETATALEDTKTRLETLYQITARLSGLSLADYLR